MSQHGEPSGEPVDVTRVAACSLYPALYENDACTKVEAEAKIGSAYQ